MRKYKSYIVYSESQELSIECIQLSRGLKVDLQRTIGEQIIRSAISIPSNIAEGASRSSEADFRKFLGYSISSAHELQCQLEILQRITGISTISRLIKRCTLIQVYIAKLLKRINSHS